MELLVKDKIYINNPPDNVLQWIAQMSTFENPENASRVKRGSWLGNLQQYVYLYEIFNNNNGSRMVACPRGLLRPLYDTFKNTIPIDIKDERILPKVDEFHIKDTITIRDYQKEAIDTALLRAQGIVVSPAGSGKTVMGVAISQGCKSKTLWFTHKKELIQQTKDRFMEYTDIPEERIGIYGDGSKDIEDITIATVQTLANMDAKTFNEFVTQFGCVIVDEVHHAAADTWRMIDRFPARYRIGLTATPVRGDGLTEAAKAVVGKEIYTVDRQRLVVDKRIMKAKMYYTVTPCNYDEYSKDHPTLLRVMSNDPKRNEILVKLADVACQTRDCLLVLTNLVYHTENLAELIRARLEESKLARPVFTFHAQSKFKIDDIKDLDQFVIVATFGKAEEGLDIPKLDCLLLASPLKGDVKNRKRLEQSLGRIERTMIGKKAPIVYDVVDSDGLSLYKWDTRQIFYAEKGIETKGMDIPSEYLDSL